MTVRRVAPSRAISFSILIAGFLTSGFTSDSAWAFPCGNSICEAPQEDPCNCDDCASAYESNETTCDDGIDNDCDENVDCADSQCVAAPGCTIQNDTCGTATSIADGLTNFSNVGAATDGPSHAGDGCQGDGQTYHDIWFDYTATCTGTLSVTTCDGLTGATNFDTDIVVYDGCGCAPLDFLACNDDIDAGQRGTGQSLAIAAVTQNQCYKIRVGGGGSNDEGLGQLLIDCMPVGPFCGDGICQPASEDPCSCKDCVGSFESTESSCDDGIDNDCDGTIDCADATCAILPECNVPNDDCINRLAIATGLTPFSNVGATTDGQSHAANGCQLDGQTYNDVWFEHTATCTGDLRVTTCSGFGGSANYDSDIVIYASCICSTPAFGACNDNGSGPECSSGASRAELQVLVDQCVIIRVGGSGASDFGSGSLSITCTPAGPTCGNKICEGPNEDPCNCDDCAGDFQQTESSCNDGIDNDCDEAIDCNDSDCSCGCTSDSECALADANACTCNECVADQCVSTPIEFGDVTCDGPPQPNLDDILCVLSGFANFNICPNGDIAPNCVGNDAINLDDILAVLAAFSGGDPCNCTP